MEHPIALPPHVETKLIDEAPRFRDSGAARERWLIQRAAQLGADQELKASTEWVSQWCGRWPDGTRPEDALRAARRPKPPNLKQQALDALGPEPLPEPTLFGGARL